MSDLDQWNDIPDTHPQVRAWAANVTRALKAIGKRQEANEVIIARLIKRVRELEAALAPAPPPVQARYGVNLGNRINTRSANNQDAEIAEAVAAGARIARVDRPTNTVVDKLIAAGIQPYAVLRNNQLGPGAFTPAQFASACATRAAALNGKVSWYELLERPDRNGWSPDSYLPYLKAAYVAIKAVSPTATIVHAGVAERPAEWYARLYEIGGRPYFDMANLHCYGHPADPGSEWASFPQVRAIMDANGDTLKPIIVTEAGANLNTHSAGDAANAITAALQRADGQGVTNGATLYTLAHTLVDDDTDTPGFGMVTAGGTRRPAFAAFQAVATP